MTLQQLIDNYASSVEWKNVFIHQDSAVGGKCLEALSSIRTAFGLRFEERDYHGYYAVFLETRSLWGLPPITWNEMAICLLYIIFLLFGNLEMLNVIILVELFSGFYQLDPSVVQTVQGWMQCYPPETTGN